MREEGHTKKTKKTHAHTQHIFHTQDPGWVSKRVKIILICCCYIQLLGQVNVEISIVTLLLDFVWFCVYYYYIMIISSYCSFKLKNIWELFVGCGCVGEGVANKYKHIKKFTFVWHKFTTTNTKSLIHMPNNSLTTSE